MPHVAQGGSTTSIISDRKRRNDALAENQHNVGLSQAFKSRVTLVHVLLCAHGGSLQMRWPYGSVTTSFIEYGSTPLLIVQDLPSNDIRRTRAEVVVEEHVGH